MNPRDLLLVMFLESGVNPSQTNIANPQGARGLIQFMPDTLKAMNVSDKDIKNFTNKSAEEQLKYVERYIKDKNRPFKSATEYYHANFFPLTLSRWKGNDPIANRNVVVVNSRSKDQRERKAYAANKILDYNKDGKVTVGDLTSILMFYEKKPEFKSLLSKLNSVAGQGTVSEKSHGKVRQMQSKPKSNSFSDFISSIESMLDSFLKSAQDNNMKKCKSNNYLISINSDNDFESKLQFTRILSIALKEEINSRSQIYTDGDNIDIRCVVNAEKERGLEVVKELCSAISNTFEFATKKIGGVKIYTLVSPDLKSDYQNLDIKIADINYRKFHLKFAK
jgi:hypothetical protein